MRVSFTSLGNIGADPRGRVAVEEIAKGLEKLGASEYAQRFAENRIDLTVLSDLTDPHRF